MRATLLALSLLVLVVGASEAKAMLADVPLAQLVVDSDLVVTCEVTDLGSIGKQMLQPPGWPRARNMTVQTAGVNVLEVLHDKNGTFATPEDAKKKAAARKIVLIYQAREPVPPGQMRIMVSDELSYPALRVGSKLLVIVSKIKGKTTYFLPSYPKNFVLLTGRNNERAAEIRRVANIDKWPWSKPSAGLQMAVVVERPEVYLSTVRRRRGGPIKQSAYVQFASVLRNASKKPVAINTYPPDKLLALTYAEQGGADRAYDLYAFLARADMRAFGDWSTKVLKPGEMTLITPWGTGQGHGQQFEVGEGKLTLKMKYASTRDGVGKDRVKLWKGEVSAPAATINVKKRNAQPAAPGRVRKLPIKAQ